MKNLFASLFKAQKAYPDITETERLLLEKQNCTDLTAIEFFIILKETNEKIGTVVMLFDGEIWYKVDEPFRNKGFATEAVSKMIDISERNYFYLSISFTNRYSIKLAKKLGFTYKERISKSLIFEKEKS